MSECMVVAGSRSRGSCAGMCLRRAPSVAIYLRVLDGVKKLSFSGIIGCRALRSLLCLFSKAPVYA